jgi:hypoxanthine phosphoribosyltransferase
MKEALNYEHYGLYIELLVQMIKRSELFEQLKYIYPIPRGGYPIGVHLSHNLHLPLIVTHPAYHKKEHILVVDDIADTGITLEKFAPMAAATATLYYKKRSTIKPTFFVMETDKWIIFPWEHVDEIPNREI